VIRGNRRRPSEDFLIVRPEVSGHTAGDGSITFDTWLGDDLIAAHPSLLVTTRLKRDLERLPSASGFAIVMARTSASTFFRCHRPGQRLPVLWLVKILGEAGRDDLGLAQDGAIVASKRVLNILLRHRVARASFAQYRPLPLNADRVA
jgi:hypothetical protein